MSKAIELDVTGTEEANRLLAEYAGRQLQNRMRRATRAGAKVFREAIRAEAKTRGDLPATMAKTRTLNHRNPIGVSVGPRSPLWNIFEHGAQAHAIGEPGQLLSNFGAAGADGAPFAARGPVQHPGVEARPFVGPLFDARRTAAENAIEGVLFEDLR